jgi:hypothetical protein
MQLMPQSLVPVLTPQGALRLDVDTDGLPLDDAVADRLLTKFAGGGGHGLLQLGTGEAGSQLPPALGFWRAFAVQFVTALCGHDGAATARTLPPVSAPSSEALTALAEQAPPMPGARRQRAAAAGLSQGARQPLEVRRPRPSQPR